MIDFVYMGLSPLIRMNYRLGIYVLCPYRISEVVHWSVWNNEIRKSEFNYQLAVL